MQVDTINTLMHSQHNDGYYTGFELQAMGFKSLGQNVLISRKAQIYAPHKISLGSHIRIDDFVILSGAINLGNFIHLGAFSSITGGDGVESSVSFGDFCGMSSYSKIFATTDDFAGGYLVGPCVPLALRNVKGSHIVLEKHCHIGSHSLVLPKSYFSIGASLGPMSLNMGRKLKPWSYYFGNPAKKIYTIDSCKILEKEAQMLQS
ncbi:acyltransferase [Helicobacter labetoulli]|uniref:acyltransferase n=1 Tax=Helicobacter labetoulli TaxID=2315333 RepID=UPI000EF65CE6|nr:galactoside O-acetyltransferase [Helicobacter labetoulli]